MENWQIESLKALLGILVATVTYCLGRRTRIEEKTANREEFDYRRKAKKSDLHEAASLLDKFSDLKTKLTEKGQSVEEISELMKAARRIDELAEGTENEQEIGEILAGLIDDAVQYHLELCIIIEQYMQLSDECGEPADPYYLARLDLHRMMLLSAVTILEHPAPKQWGFPRDPIGVLAKYTKFVRGQLDNGRLGELAIEFAESVSWTREEMELYVAESLEFMRHGWKPEEME